jgi:hypothetical protein
MRISKSRKNKNKLLYKIGYFLPTYPYTLKRRGYPVISKCKKFTFTKIHPVCRVCDGYGYILRLSGYDTTCICETLGKGVAYARKVYINR